MKALPWQFFFKSLSEDLPLEEVVDEVRDFDERFGIILRRHIAVLGWWCILNLVVSIPVMLYFDNWLWYFVVMNLSWAVINFAIVLRLYDHVFYLPPGPCTNRPGVAPVCSPSRSTCTPFTKTCATPVAYWWGSAKVA